MKKKITAILAAVIALTASLSASRQAAAQPADRPAAMTFTTQEHDFGVQKEDGGKLSHSFTFTNRSKKAHTILEAQSYCRCTVASFDRKEFGPGESGTVTVTFEPYGYDGPTEKSVVVIFDDKSTARLTVRTDLIPRVKPVEEEYPIVMENGIRLTADALRFGQVAAGETKTVAFKAYNTNSKPVKMAFEPKTADGMSVSAPSKLAPRKGTEIAVTYKASEKPHFVSETISPTFSGIIPVIGGSTSATVIEVTADFIAAKGSGTSWISSQYINLGSVQKPAKGQPTAHKEAVFTITNKGTGPLTVHDICLPEGLSSELKAGTVLKEGEKVTFTIRLDASALDSGTNYFQNMRILTSDMEYPVREIIVSAKIR